MTTKKLTASQREVMTWLNGGHRARVEYGSVVFINGRKVCNVATMLALESRGLAQRIGRYEWCKSQNGETECLNTEVQQQEEK